MNVSLARVGRIVFACLLLLFLATTLFGSSTVAANDIALRAPQTTSTQIVFSDNFETDQGWVTNPDTTDSASAGLWERTDPQQTVDNGTVVQLDVATSGSHALVTEGDAGATVGSHDVDLGNTTIESPEIELPTEGTITLSLNQYLAYSADADATDQSPPPEGAPVIEVSNISGVVGQEIGIFGSNFGVFEGTVTIFGVPATITEWNDTFVRAVVPDVADGTDGAGLEILANNGTFAATSEFTVYTVHPQWLRMPETAYRNVSYGKAVELQNVSIAQSQCTNFETGQQMTPYDYLTNYMCRYDVGAKFSADSAQGYEAIIAIDFVEPLTVGPHVFQFFSRADWSAAVLDNCPGTGYPLDFVIEGSADNITWSQPLTTVTGNLRGNNAYQVDVPDNTRWLRMRVTDSVADCRGDIPAKDFELKEVRVYEVTGSASQAADAFAIYGDSNAASSFNRYVGGQSLNARFGEYPSNMPVATLGFAGFKADNLTQDFEDPNELVDAYSDDAIAGSALYWGFALGTNDMNMTGVNDIGFIESNSPFNRYADIMSVDAIEWLIARGHIPILARMPDTNESQGGFGFIEAKVKLLNDIDRLAAQYQLIPGPDFYTEFRVNIERNSSSWIAGDGTHFTDAGRQQWLNQWADVLETVHATRSVANNSGPAVNESFPWIFDESPTVLRLGNRAARSVATDASMLRVSVVGSTSQSVETVFEEVVSAETKGGVWQSISVNLDSFAGETVRVVIEAADYGEGVVVEAGIDDVEITVVTNNATPVLSDINNQTDLVGSAVSVPVTATDENGDDITITATNLPDGLTLSPLNVIEGIADTIGTYNVTISAEDNRGASDTISFVWIVEEDIALPVGCAGNGLLQEWWYGIPGAAISDLTSHSDYPDTPTGSSILDSAEIANNVRDDYGLRLRGYVVAPATGDYTFWIASDDNGSLLLSSNTNPANAVEIASVSSWTNPREWGKFSEQQSDSISLQQGELYYLEALVKEWWGGDNLSIAWQTPGGSQQLIPLENLCVFERSGVAPTAVLNANQTSGQAPFTVAFDGTGSSDADGSIVRYEWQFGDGAALISETATHTFVNPGLYTAKLTVVDEDGRSSVDTVDITVEGSSESVSSCTTPGVLHEWWNDIGGTSIGDLTSNGNYPSSPSGSDIISEFETPSNRWENYGVRVRAYINAPVTGEYTFWIASDDNGSLLLSSDDSADNAIEIARVNNWTPAQQWDWFVEQRSEPVTLIAGQRYYIEALMKEAGGGDNLAVAWQAPGGQRQVIPSVVLCPYVIDTSTPTAAIATNAVEGNLPFVVTFDGSGSSDNDGTILTHSWAFGDGATATGESVSHTYTAAGIYSAELTVTDNDGKSSSETVQISVYDPAATASCNTSGLLAEYWLGINGNALSSLYDNALYPSQPSGSLIATDFEASLNQEDYGLRMRGYIVPPFTGNYRFWIASDDQGALLLSTDINPANATEIASVPDWTGNQEWDKFTEQRSARVSLVAGELYYIEALMKEGFGGDHLAVAWRAPGGERELITSESLCAFETFSSRSAENPTVELAQFDATEPLSLSPLGQSIPAEHLVELMWLLSADQQLRDQLFRVQAMFEQLLATDGELSAEFVAEVESAFVQLKTRTSPEFTTWLNSIYPTTELAEHTNQSARTAWSEINANSATPTIPTAVTFAADSAAAGSNVSPLIVTLGLLLGTFGLLLGTFGLLLGTITVWKAVRRDR